ncbi:MAG: sigma-70 family RNA polymerase sigma factor [Bacteroidota bacterium]
MKSPKQEKQLDQYLEGVRQRNPIVLKEVYTRFFPMLAQHVRTRGGREEDAQDVFQDAVVVLFRKAQDPDFELTSAFGTFLFGIGKKIWLKKASRRGKRPEQSLEDETLAEEFEVEAELERTERNQLFRAKIQQLGQNCQKLLRLFFEGRPMKKIAQEMGFASDGYAKKRKFQCKQKLTQLIKADPRYAEMTN